MRSRFVAFLMVIATFSCRRDAEAPSSSADGVTLALTLSSNQLNRGQSDTLAMTLTNTTSRSVSLSTGACDPRPIIVHTHNHVVVGAEPCILILLRLQLAPGEQHRRLFVWRTDSLSPGVYYVRATFRSEEVKLATPSETVRLN